MTRSKQILSLAEQHHGVVTTAMVVSAGLPRGSLKYLADTGRLDRSSRGVYILPDAWDDEMVNIQSRYKRGIFSLNTALFLCDLTDRTPSTYHMTFPNTYNFTGPKRYGIVCHGIKEPLYSLGIEDLKTPGGTSVRAYGAERTLCDILKPQSQTDIQMIADAFKRYVARKDRNIPLLSEYARMLGVEKRVRTYLEVLL